MTSNQIAARAAKETERSNRSKENLTKEANDIKRYEANTNRRKVNVDSIARVAQGIGHVVGAINDPSWYNLDKKLVEDTARISFNTPLGNPIADVTNKKLSVPGIQVLNFIPTLGKSTGADAGDIVNNAAKQIYAYVRYANSGSRNYESADLMKYILAMDQAYSYHGMLTRIYSAALTAKSENRYWIDAMLQALGVDPNDIRSNLANLRAYINSFAVRLNSLYVPNSLPIYQRHYWMNTNFFKDQPVKKSQLYVFLQEAFGIYFPEEGMIQFSHKMNTATSSTVNPNQLMPYFRPGANITLKQLTTFGNYMLNVLLSDEDIGIMSGDILKAYGNSNCLFVNSIADDFHIEAIYSEEVLSQITNCFYVGEIKKKVYKDNSHANETGFNIKENTEKGDIYQGDFWYVPTEVGDSGQGIVARVLGTSNEALYNLATHTTTGLSNVLPLNFEYALLNMYKDDVTPDELMVATRLRPHIGKLVKFDAGTSLTNNIGGFFMAGYGTELVTYPTIVTINTDGTITNHTYSCSADVFQNNVNAIPNIFQWIDRFGKFDWNPTIYFLVEQETSGNYSYTYYGNLRDNANTASVANATLDNMHFTAVMSEFGIPKLGMTVRTR